MARNARRSAQRNIMATALGAFLALAPQRSLAIEECRAYHPDIRASVEYQEPGVDAPCVPRDDTMPVPTVDMSQYLVAAQTETDARQFYLTGHMECFGGECERAGDPRIAEGMYGKSYWLPTTDGIPRFVQTKAPRVPSEFFSIRGNAIFLEEEVMTWDAYESIENSEYRDHHDKRGNSNHLWNRIDDVAKRFVSPNIGDFFLRYCDSGKAPVPISFHDGGYFILGPYNLSTGNLADIERELAPYGTGIEQKWLGINEALGRPEQPVELVVRVNYWGPHGRSKSSSLRDWGAQETYWYIKGAGFVRWNVGDKLRPDDKLFIWKQGTLHTPVWEPEGRAVRALGLCDRLDRSNDVPSDMFGAQVPQYAPRGYTR